MDSKDKNKSTSLLANWKNHIKSENKKTESHKTAKGNRFQASGAQKRIFFLHQLYNKKSVYNLTELWEFRGPLIQEYLLSSFDKVCESQDLLRAHFESKDGNIKYILNEGRTYDFEFIDLRKDEIEKRKSNLAQIAKEKSKIEFDLEKSPLLNITLCQTKNETFHIIINIHHIISDKWSMQLFRKELSRYYTQLTNGASLIAEHKFQYEDYVNYELKKIPENEDIQYWKEKLKSHTAGVTFPAQKNKTSNTSLTGAYTSRNLPIALYANIKDFCNQNKLTPFAFFLSVYKLLIYKYTSEKDITVGTPISTRSKVDFENIIGFFNDTIVLRTMIQESTSFLDFLNTTKKTVLEAFKHKNLNFDQLIKTLKPNRVENQNPFFSLMFLFHKEFKQLAFTNEITLDVANFDMGVSKFDLTLYIGEHSDHFETIIEYASDLYSESYVQEIIQHYFNLIDKVLKNPNKPINQIELLDDDAEKHLIAIGKGVDFSVDSNYNLVESIFAQAEKQAYALKDENTQYTYEELDKKSNAVAEELLIYKPNEKRVAIIMNQSSDFIVAMIGALKAGYAYVPLDIEYPQDHINYVLENAKIELIIGSNNNTLKEQYSQKYIDITRIGYSDFTNKDIVSQDDIAYVIYTSGSTGKPKGAKISHGNLINSTLARFHFYEEQPDSYLLLSSLSFDSSVAGIYWTLLNGGTLVIPDKKSFNDIDKLSKLIVENKTSHSLLIPSLYSAFLEFIPKDTLEHFKVIILAGEKLPLTVAKKHQQLLRKTRLYNEYGPTEATVWASAYEIKDAEKLKTIPIGKAIGNSTLLILDEHFNLVPKGLEGELFISGKSVCQNYLYQEDKKDNPFVSTDILGKKTKLYRTGDWVKWNEENELLFLERKDRQLKIRGHRIELGEIDSKIRRFDPSIETITVFHKSRKELIAFISSNKNINKEELKLYIKSKLPKHYIPNKFLSLEKFPTLPNGKIDVKKLENYIFKNEIQTSSSKDISDFEAKMLQIWRETLNIHDLNIHDNYFEAGGDSIQIIRIIAKAKKQDIKISVNDIYKHQNIHKLGLHTSQKEKISEQILLFDKLPISPIQEWFFDTFKNKPGHWCLGLSFDLNQKHSVNAFKDAVKQLIQKYPVLKIVFKKEYKKWFQVPSNFHIDEIVYSEIFQADKFTGFNIETGPLCRFYINEKEGNVSSGHVVIHHLIIDALSWDNLFSFLDAEISNENKIELNPSQEYFKWIIEQNQLASTNYHDKDLNHWLKINNQNQRFLLSKGKSTEEKTETKHFTLNKTLSQNIKTLGRQLSDLTTDEMITACFLDVYQEQTKESSVNIMLERHGRKGENIDLSDSIGWHTSFFPVHFSISKPGNIYQTLLDVKEQIRRTPNEGKSFGILKYLSNKLPKKPIAKIIINHLGDSFNQEYRQFNNLQSLIDGMRSATSERDQFIEINSWFKNDQLHLSFSYDTSHFSTKEIDQWLYKLESRLNILERELLDQQKVYTPSDFNFVTNQNELEKLITTSKKMGFEIDSIIKPTAAQTALLFHNLQNPNDDQGLIHASAKIYAKLNTEILQIAWNKVIEKNDVLKSCILWKDLESPFQIVSKDLISKIEFIDTEKAQTKAIQIDTAPSHKLICFKKSKEEHILQFTCHHIFLDGWSTYNILNQLVDYYKLIEAGKTIQQSHSIDLKEWSLKFDEATQDSDLIDFWINYLKGAKSSLIKPISTQKKFNQEVFKINESLTKHLDEMLKASRITLTGFISGVWSYLLAKYLKQNESIIGITHAGRSLEIDNMDELNGMFSTVLPLRVKQKNSNKINFKNITSDFQKIVTLDAVSLEDLSTNSKITNRQLFDTIVIVENFAKTSGDSEGIQLTEYQSQISTTLPLSIIILPGKELQLKLRYNEMLFTKDEILEIQKDLTALMSNIDIEDGIAEISTKENYELSIPERKELSLSPITSLDVDGLDLENYLRKRWMEILQLNDISLTDDFFELGGTSMQAVRIFNQINNDLNINASPIVILKNKTIKKLAAWLDKNQSEDSWQCLFPLKKSGSLNPLFCFHAGEGHILFYKELAENMDENRPVYGIQSAGLDGSNRESQEISEMASFYLSEIKKQYPNGPYHLLGTCFSNAVVFEIAKKIGVELGSLIIVDSPPPYYREFSKLGKWLNWVKTFNISKLKEAAGNYFKYSNLKIPEGEQERNLFLTGKYLRNVLSNYKWEPGQVEINLIRSKQNADDPFKSYHIANWQLLAKKGIRIKTIDGDHLGIFNGNSAQQMANELNTILLKDEG